MTPIRNLRSRRGGFTLVEILVVLLIFGVLIAMAALVTRAITAAQYRSLTNTRLATIDSALMQFVQQQRRLPCPADGTKDSTANNVGLELRNAGGCTTNQAGGVVPWRTLGLSETETTDGWGRRFTYRLDPKLALDGGMDISWCDPAGTEVAGTPPRPCNTTCNSSALASCTKPVDFLRGLGLLVKNNQALQSIVMNPEPSPSTNPPTGAAYVVISPGESGGGGYLGSGQLSTSNTTDGGEESKNYANQAFTSVTATYYVDDSINSSVGGSHFDDIVSRPSVLSVANKAGLGPRSH